MDKYLWEIEGNIEANIQNDGTIVLSVDQIFMGNSERSIWNDGTTGKCVHESYQIAEITIDWG